MNRKGQITASRSAGGVWGWIRSLLQRTEADEAAFGEPAVAGPQQSSQASHRKAASSSTSNQEFEARLQEVLRQQAAGSPVVGGRVNLLNVSTIREKLGERWERLSERVHGIVSDTLKHRLGSADFFTRVGEDAYVIVFGDLAPHEAKLKCSLLGQEIMRRIFGETEASAIELLGIQTVASGVDGTLAGIDVTSAAALSEFLDHVERDAPQAEGSRPPETASTRQPLTPEEVARLLGDVHDQVAALEVDASSGRAPALLVDRLEAFIRQLREVENALALQDTSWTTRTLEAGHASNARVPDWETQKNEVRRLIDRVEKEVARQQEVPLSEATELPQPEVQFSYVPIWHVGAKMLGMHLCQVESFGQGDSALDLNVVDGDQRLDLLETIDRMVLRKVKQDLQRAHDSGQKIILSATVHYATLDRLGPQADFLRICHAIPDELRRLLVWEIVDCPVDCWRSRMPELSRLLRPFAKAILVRSDLGRAGPSHVFDHLSVLQQAQVHGIGVDVNLLSKRMAETQIIRLFDAFAAAGNRFRLKCFAHGIDSMPLAAAAIGAGFDLLSGGAFAARVQNPRQIHSATVEDFYERYFDRKLSAGSQ